MRPELLEAVWAHEELADLDVGERRLALRSLIASNELDCSIQELADWVDGWGPLSSLMRDPEVTDVLVNGPDEVWVERAGYLVPEGALFRDADELNRLLERLLGEAGVQANASRPLVDARLKEGSRLHVVLPPVAPRGPLVSIRRFPREGFRLDDLVARGMLEQDHAERLMTAVSERLTIAISGGTGSGKTTLLNALLGCIGPDERVVVVEESAELRPLCTHWVSLIARAKNADGRGEIDLASLVRAALRMRPDRIVVGEIRGPEALAALAAMSTGHPGSMVTIHARSGNEALNRMVALALSARTGLSESALTSSVCAAIDVTVHLERIGGRRRVAEIERVV